MTPKRAAHPGGAFPFPAGRESLPPIPSVGANAHIGPLPIPPQAAGGRALSCPAASGFSGRAGFAGAKRLSARAEAGTLISQGSLPTGPEVTTVLQGQAAFARTPKGEFQRGTAAPLKREKGAAGGNTGRPPQTNGVWKRIAPKGQEVPPENCGGKRRSSGAGETAPKAASSGTKLVTAPSPPAIFLGPARGSPFDWKKNILP